MGNRMKVAAVLLVFGASVAWVVTPALAEVDVGEDPAEASAPEPAEDDHLTQSSTPTFEEPEGQPAPSPLPAAGDDPPTATPASGSAAGSSASASGPATGGDDGAWSDTPTWASDEASAPASSSASAVEEHPEGGPGIYQGRTEDGAEAASASTSASASPGDDGAWSDTQTWAGEAGGHPDDGPGSYPEEEVTPASASASAPSLEEPVPAAEPAPDPASWSDAAGWGQGSDDGDWATGEDQTDGATVMPEPDNTGSWSASAPPSPDDGTPWLDNPTWAQEQGEPPTEAELDEAFGNDPDYQEYEARRRAAEEAHPWSDTETWASEEEPVPAGGPEDAADYFGTAEQTPASVDPYHDDPAIEYADGGPRAQGEYAQYEPPPCLSIYEVQAATCRLLEEEGAVLDRVGPPLTIAGPSLGEASSVGGTVSRLTHPFIEPAFNTARILARGEEGPVHAAGLGSARALGGEVGTWAGFGFGVVAQGGCPLANGFGPSPPDGSCSQDTLEWMADGQQAGEQIAGGAYDAVRDTVNEHPQGAAEVACSLVVLPSEECADDLRRGNEAVLDGSDTAWETVVEGADWLWQAGEREIEEYHGSRENLEPAELPGEPPDPPEPEPAP